MAVPDPVPPRSIRQRFLRIMRVAAAFSIVIAALAVALVARGQSELHIHMLIATALGIGLTVLLGTALMTLTFLTNRSGHDAAAGSAPPRKRRIMTEPHRGAILRVVPGPGDINANGHIFGGWVLSQMDIAAGIVASRRVNGSVATVAIDRMEFLSPIHLRDLISVYAEVEKVGRTSMQIKIEVIATRDRGATEVKVTEGMFTFVAIDEEARPRAIDSPG